MIDDRDRVRGDQIVTKQLNRTDFRYQRVFFLLRAQWAGGSNFMLACARVLLFLVYMCAPILSHLRYDTKYDTELGIY